MDEWIEYTCEFSVRFRDTDAYGVVHHSNYFCYFEEARYDFARKILKFNDEDLFAVNFKFPVLEAECRYRKAVTYEKNNFNVVLKFRTISNCKLEFLYELKCPGGKKIYASGRTVHAIVDENNKLCITIPQMLLEKIMRGKESNDE